MIIIMIIIIDNNDNNDNDNDNNNNDNNDNNDTYKRVQFLKNRSEERGFEGKRCFCLLR